MGQFAENDAAAHARAAAAAVTLAHAWVGFWDAVRALEDQGRAPLCRHCGKPPEADGDHPCPCPYRDDNCPDHPPEGKPVPLWMTRVIPPAVTTERGQA